jgi:WD40 repeat protein
MNTHTNSRTWMALVILVFAVIIAIAGIIYGWQANVNSKIANQSLATAQADEQGMSSQVALAESTAQEAHNAQATAESDAQQRALVEALTDQEVQAAQEQARLATSRRLAAQALNTLELDPQLSAHLALQAYEAAYTFEAESALHRVLPNLRLLKSTLIRDIVPNANWRWEYLARNGELLAVGTDEGIEVVDMTTGKRSLFALGMSCSGFSVSPDGQWLAAVCELDDGVLMNDALLTWEIKTQELLSTISNLESSLHIYGMIQPSLSHALMLFGKFWDGPIHIWDVISGEERLVIPVPADDSFQSIDASPDGNFLAIVYDSGLVELWGLDTNEKLIDFDPHSKPWSVVFSPDATRLATVRNTIQIWDISSLAAEPVLLQEIIPNLSLYGLMYSPDGNRLAGCGDDGKVQVWQVETGRLSMTLYGQSGYSWPLAFSQDGNRLYTASDAGTLNEWDVSPGGGLMALTGTTGNDPYSPDGKLLALASKGGYLSIVDSQSAEVQLSWQADADWSSFSEVAWSPDGEHLATFHYRDNTAKIWEAATGRLLLELPGSPESAIWGNIDKIAWSPDGKRIATLDGAAILVWDVDAGEQLLTLETKYGMGFPDLDFSPDGTKIAYGHSYYSDGHPNGYYELVIWDSTDGAELFRLDSDSGQAFNPGGGRKVLARATNPNLQVWVSPSWSKKYSHGFRPSFGYLSGISFAMDFSPDGKYLAAVTPEGIILWEFTPGGVEQVQIFGNPRHGNVYISLAFSPDGTLLASSSGDGRIRVWDLETGQVRWEVDGWGPIAFSPDGTHFTSSSNGITTIHMLLVDELIDLVHARIIRPMTAEECLTYLHEVSCPP